jgi:hypothetical protein
MLTTHAYSRGCTKVLVSIAFTTTLGLTPDSTIEIQFPSSVPGIWAHCHSQISSGSMLKSRANNGGEVGCTAQYTRSWVITGFNALAAGQLVKVFGRIDLPLVSGNLGLGKVRTYANSG